MIERYKEFYLPDNRRPVSNSAGARTTAFIAHSVGFRGQALEIITAIAGGESSWDSEQWTPPTTGKGNDRGLFQINDYWHGPFSDDPVRVTDEDALNPWTAAQAVWEISRQGTKWGAWKAYTDQSKEYLRQLPYAKEAAAWVEAGGISLIQVKVEGGGPVFLGDAAMQLGTSNWRLRSANPKVVWPAAPGTLLTLPRGLRPAHVYRGPRKGVERW